MSTRIIQPAMDVAVAAHDVTSVFRMLPEAHAVPQELYDAFSALGNVEHHVSRVVECLSSLEQHITSTHPVNSGWDAPTVKNFMRALKRAINVRLERHINSIS